MQKYRGEDIPEDIRQRPTTSDPALNSAEKELRVTGHNDEEELSISTEIPTVIKWILSVSESEVDWVRVNGDGAVVACHATIPKGIVKLQGTARKSNTHSQMVTYGDEWGDDDE
jgi:hypothetical protein